MHLSFLSNLPAAVQLAASAGAAPAELLSEAASDAEAAAGAEGEAGEGGMPASMWTVPRDGDKGRSGSGGARAGGLGPLAGVLGGAGYKRRGGGAGPERQGVRLALPTPEEAARVVLGELGGCRGSGTVGGQRVRGGLLVPWGVAWASGV